MKLTKEIVLCEVGPRDGLQNEKVMVSTERKIELINRTVDAGVKVIEVGSFVHPKAVPQLADTDEVVKRAKKLPGVEFRALISNLRGAERGIACGIDKIKLVVSASKSHNRSNFNQSPAESIRGFEDCVNAAVKGSVEVSAAVGTAFGCPFEGKLPLEQIKAVVESFIELGITEISMSDTTGMANPLEVYQQCIAMKEAYPQVKWILHFHNTRGMALANIIAGMQAGVTWFDSSFSGLGGCPYAPGASGNVATEDVLNMCEDMRISTGIDIDKMIEVAKLAREYVGHATESFILKAGKTTDLAGYKPKGQERIRQVP